MASREAFRKDLEEKLNLDPAHAESVLSVADSSGLLGGPDPTTTSAIWLIVVGSFSLVLVASAVTLLVGVFSSAPETAKALTTSETILAVFTTVAGFLAGMLSPSPVKSGG